MKKITVALTIMCLSFSFTACSSEKSNQVKEDKVIETEKPTEQMTTSEPKTEEGIVAKEDYQEYSGYWSENGYSHDEIVANGGTELFCSITESNLFEGWIFAQQGLTERIVEIDNISGEIKNNEMFFDFADDGWGNSGTLHIIFSMDTIDIGVNDFIMDEENSSGYGFSGDYTFIKRNEIEKETQSNVTQAKTEEIIEEVNARSQHYKSSKYYEQVTNYWEVNRQTTDIANVLEMLFDTDTVLYSENSLVDEPDFIIHLGKNEIMLDMGTYLKMKI